MKGSEFSLFRAPGFGRRFASIALALGVLMSLLPLSAAVAGSFVLEVRNWTRDSQSGLVTYDLLLTGTATDESRGPCATACTWKVEAYFGSGDSASYVTRLGKGGGAPSFTQSLTATNVSLPEITHLRAELYPYYSGYGRYDTGYIQVASPAEGGIRLAVNKWDRNLNSGLVSYDLRMSYWGAGKWYGPCHSACNWSVQAYYRDGSSDILVTTLGNGSAGGWSSTRDLVASDVSMKEVTHLRAKLYPYYSGYESLDTGLIQVASPFEGGIALAVNHWEFDSATGSVTYDLDVDAWGAGRWKGPCESACLWKIEGWSGTDPSQNPVATVADGTAGGWTYKTNAAGSKSLSGITHLKAKLYPYYSGYESFATGLIFVGDHMANDDDLVPDEFALAPALLHAPHRFCEPLFAAGGALPSTDDDSVPDAAERCEEAILIFGPQNVRKVLGWIAVGTGGVLALTLLVDEHADDGPIPSDDEMQNPSQTWEPPPDWEDNGCYQGPIFISAEREDHVNNRHTWGADQGASEFKSNVNWKSLLRVDALREMAYPEPGKEAFQCERIVTYSRDVGFDAMAKKMTRVYTVITKKNGDLVTTFPGLPLRLYG
ncbi:MAG: hypothetical protein ABR505_04115 [Actinomycetota bacterium]